MFQADELRSIIDKAGVQLRAMIYLGINCGLGNNDCAMLPMRDLDLDKGWLDFPRPKTGVERRCPLWPETVEALRAALEKRHRRRKTQPTKIGYSLPDTGPLGSLSQLPTIRYQGNDKGAEGTEATPAWAWLLRLAPHVPNHRGKDPRQ